MWRHCSKTLFQARKSPQKTTSWLRSTFQMELGEVVLSFSSSATYISLQSSNIMITVSIFLCVFQQVFRRKQITKTWPSVIPRKTVCKFVWFCILSQCTQQIPQSPAVLLFTKLGCIIAQSCLLQERSRFLSQKEKKKPSLLVTLSKSTYLFPGMDHLSLGLSSPPSNRASAPTLQKNRRGPVLCRETVWEGLFSDRNTNTRAYFRGM